MVHIAGPQGQGGENGPGMAGPYGAQALARAMPGSEAGFSARLPGKLRRVIQRDAGQGGGSRPWKIATALGLLGAGIYAMLDDQFTLSTEHAVVSAYTVGLRSPIAGQVGGLRHAPGEAIAAGALLAVVEDPRADQQRLVDLRALHDRARAELAAALGAQALYRDLAADLSQRAGLHQEMALTRYASQQAEAERLLAGTEARLLRDRQNLVRKQQLVASRFGTQADLDGARADHDVSLRAVEAQQQHLLTLQTQQDGVRRGVFIEAGHVGFNYAQQRLDEVSMRIADLDRGIVSLTADFQAAVSRLGAEQRRTDQQSLAELSSPSGGLVWRVLAQEGERVAVGETVVEVMDCDAAFVLAAIPQHRAAEVQLGGIARFRLAGESRERSGRVQAVLGEGSVRGERNLAALPTRPAPGAALVRVALAPAEPGAAAGCPVGRTARLVLPTGEGGLFGRVLAAR